jgi:D-inositol-3-phosphate glycosyltransferase
LTAHNVNAASRDGRDSWLNCVTLRAQYRLCHHIFVHTERMKSELVAVFSVPRDRVTVIPFGINETIPTTSLSAAEARQQLGLQSEVPTVLAFGQIAGYKGLEYLATAIGLLAAQGVVVQVVIAGKIKRGWEEYWEGVQKAFRAAGVIERVTMHARFIPDEEVERYFKAADAVVLPYADIFQSGVPFLAFSFGLPIIATDVGSLREDVIEGETGFLCKPRNPDDLARAIARFLASGAYADRHARKDRIRALARERHSWTTVGKTTRNVYDSLLAW